MGEGGTKVISDLTFHISKWGTPVIASGQVRMILIVPAVVLLVMASFQKTLRGNELRSADVRESRTAETLFGELYSAVLRADCRI
jgi:hypothetical protein